MSVEISRIIDVVYTRCYEAGCFTSDNEVDLGLGCIASNVQVHEDAAGLPRIDDVIRIDGASSSVRLVISQFRSDLRSILFEVSSLLPEVRISDLELFRMSNQVHRLSGHGRMFINTHDQTWMCHGRLDLDELATDDGEVQSSNAGELLSSTEIEIGLKVFLGVLSSAKQFDRLLREQLLR